MKFFTFGFLVLCLVCFPSIVFSAVTEKPLGNTFTMDGVNPGSTGTWRSAQTASIKVEADEASNTVLKMTSTATLAFTAHSSTSSLKKTVIDVKLPSVSADSGELRLFCYNNSITLEPAGTPIVLKNGGAYVDINGEYSAFISAGTLRANVWYTVERIFDFRKVGVNKQRAAVYDENGVLVGMSPWTVCGSITGGTLGQYYFPSIYFQTVYFEESSYVQLDNFKCYTLTMSNVSLQAAFLEENHTFTVSFSEAVKENSINTESVSLSVDNIDYTDEIIWDISYLENEKKAIITYDSLPFSEQVTLTFTTFVLTADEWELPEERKFSFRTKDDPFYCENINIQYTGLTADVSVDLKNDDENEREYIIIMILRDENNGISALKAINGNLGISEIQSIQENIIKNNGNETLEVYLINNWHDMLPIKIN